MPLPRPDSAFVFASIISQTQLIPPPPLKSERRHRHSSAAALLVLLPWCSSSCSALRFIDFYYYYYYDSSSSPFCCTRYSHSLSARSVSGKKGKNCRHCTATHDAALVLISHILMCSIVGRLLRRMNFPHTPWAHCARPKRNWHGLRQRRRGRINNNNHHHNKHRARLLSFGGSGKCWWWCCSSEGVASLIKVKNVEILESFRLVCEAPLRWIE